MRITTREIKVKWVYHHVLAGYDVSQSVQLLLCQTPAEQFLRFHQSRLIPILQESADFHSREAHCVVESQGPEWGLKGRDGHDVAPVVICADAKEGEHGHSEVAETDMHVKQIPVLNEPGRGDNSASETKPYGIGRGDDCAPTGVPWHGKETLWGTQNQIQYHEHGFSLAAIDRSNKLDRIFVVEAEIAENLDSQNAEDEKEQEEKRGEVSDRRQGLQERAHETF